MALIPPPPPANIQDLLISQLTKAGAPNIAAPSPFAQLSPSLPVGASQGMPEALSSLRSGPPSSVGSIGSNISSIVGQAKGGLKGADIAGNLAKAGGPLSFGLKRALPAYGAATLPQSFIEQAVPGKDSLIEQVLQGATAGGAIGGIAGAPLLGIGALPGAALGAAGGGLLAAVGSLFGGDDKSSASKKLQNLLTSSGLPEDIRNELQVTFDILSQTTDEETALAQVGQLALSRIQESRTQEDQLQKSLAMQMLASQFSQPFAEDLLNTANTRVGVVEQLLPSLPPEYRPVALNSANAQLSSAQRLASAYGAQAQLLPGVDALRQQQSALSQAAAQQLSQALAGADTTGLGGLGGAGGGGLAELIAQYSGGAR